MGMAIFSFGGALSPLHSLMGWLGQRARREAASAQLRQAAKHVQAPRGCVARPAAVARPCDNARRPLRVVRVIDTAGATTTAGRMFMSGRMADVCAELDRLAALETAAG